MSDKTGKRTLLTRRHLFQAFKPTAGGGWDANGNEKWPCLLEEG